MKDIFKQIDKTALTTQRNKSLKGKISPHYDVQCHRKRRSSGGVSPRAETVPPTMWKIEFLFVLNSLFNLRMKFPNNSIYLSIIFGL